MSNIITQNSSTETTITRESVEDNFKLGNWFWVLDSGSEWLGCVMEIGTNFLEVHEPQTSRGTSFVRVHFKDVHQELRFEPNPHLHIQKLVQHHQHESQHILGDIQAVTARLGVSLQPSLGNAAPSAGNELMVLSGSYDVDAHKQSLIQAKEVELPDLFKKLKESNEQLARWMAAESMPMKAVMSEMKESLGVIDDRIFNVSLYAGLAEECVLCFHGEPAPYTEKLRVMQRMLFMDEESLISFRTGGMEFSNLREYDQWLAEPVNRDRILPFPRCITAMRVRRYTKEREASRCLSSALVKMSHEINDKLTYLYIRNGEKIYRLSTEIDFDEMIFPDHNEGNKPLMVKMFAHRFDEAITRDDYEERVKAYHVRIANMKKWDEENPREVWEAANPKRVYDWANPYRDNDRFRPDDWSPFDYSNVYYDDCAKVFAKRAKHFNHVALIIQGLFDRSEALHPHPQVRTWEAESFAQHIELVYDATRVICYGEAPNFEEYRARCNALFSEGSLSSGQQDYWEKKEAEKECNRLDMSWRDRDVKWRPTRYKPQGNPGPGNLAKVVKWSPNSKRAKFVWNRERIRDNIGLYSSEFIETSITVDAEHLFNVSAYKKGDYLQFFQDPRTREHYLKWAPLLMEAEDCVRRLENGGDANQTDR